MKDPAPVLDGVVQGVFVVVCWGEGRFGGCCCCCCFCDRGRGAVGGSWGTVGVERFLGIDDFEGRGEVRVHRDVVILGGKDVAVVEGLLLLDSLDDLLLEAADQARPAPRLDSDLEDEEQEHVDAHQAPGAPGTHATDLVRPDLLLVVAGQDALAQLSGGLFGLALGCRQGLLGFVLGDFVGVVVAVEVREALEVGGRPGVFPLEELVDFALRGRAAVDGGCVGVFGGADVGAGGSKSVLCFF